MAPFSEVDWFRYAAFPWLIPVAVIVPLVHLARWLERHRRPLAPSLPVSPSVPRIETLSLAGLAFGARIWALDRDPMDLLEFTYFFLSAGPRSLADLTVHEIALQQAHQPLPHLFLHLLTRFLGTDLWTLRLPSVLFGVAFVLTSHRLIRHLLPDDPWIVRGATIWVAVHPVSVYYGRDLTPYSLFAWLSTAATYALLRILDTRRRTWTVIYAFSLVALFYLHYYGIWVAFGHFAVVVAWTRWGRPGGPGDAALPLRAWILFAAGVTPWIPFFLRALDLGYVSLNITGSVFSPDLTFDDAITEGYRQFAGLMPGPWIPILLPVAAIIQSAGGVELYRRKPTAFCFTVPPLLAALLTEALFHWKLRSLTEGYYLQIRHYIYVIPAATVVGVAGVHRLARAFTTSPSLARAAGSVLAAFWIAGNIAYDVRLITTPQKADVRAAAAEIRRRAEPDDAVCVLPASFYSHLFTYYFSPPERRIEDLFGTPRWRNEPTRIFLPVTDFRVPFDVAAQNRHFRSLWVVSFREEVLDLPKFTDRPAKELLNRLAARHEIEPTVHFPFVDVTLVKLHHEIRSEWIDGIEFFDFARAETELAPFLRRLESSGDRFVIEVDHPLPQGWHAGEPIDIEFRLRWDTDTYDPPLPTRIEVSVPGVVLDRFTFQEEDKLHRLRVPGRLLRSDHPLRIAISSDRRIWYKAPPPDIPFGPTLDWMLFEWSGDPTRRTVRGRRSRPIPGAPNPAGTGGSTTSRPPIGTLDPSPPERGDGVPSRSEIRSQFDPETSR